MRWNLPYDNWSIVEDQNVIEISNSKITLKVYSTIPIDEYSLKDGWESCFYMKKERIKTFEVLVNHFGNLTTEVTW